MSPLAQLINHFDVAVRKPEDVARLKQLILQLAVRGRLVPQDPEDEPAGGLLERLRAQSAANGNRISRGLVPVSDDAVPYPLPGNWRWVQLPEVYRSIGQKQPDETFTYIDVSSIDNERGAVREDLLVLAPSEAPSRARKLVAQGSVIYSTVRPYLLNVAVIERDYDPPPIVSTAFAVLHPHEGISSRYLFYYLRSRTFVEFVEAQMTGMAYPAINDTKLNEGLVPLPPTAEQHRIVAKVDELLAAADTLAGRLAAAGARRRRFHTAALAKLTQPTAEATDVARPKTTDDRPLTTNYSTLVTRHSSLVTGELLFAHFDALYADPAAVGELKQAILQLAVMGRLVPQDPADEPAGVLLERIRAKHKDKRLFTDEDEEQFSKIPSNWILTNLGNIGDWGAGATPNRSNPKYYGGPIHWLKTGELNDGYVSSSEESVTELAIRETSLRLNQPGDVLIAMYGATIGKLGILTIEATTNQACCACTPFDGIYNKYLFYLLLSMRQEFRQQGAGGAQPNISKTKIVSTSIWLPPTAEQHRIVAKVDELFALADEAAGRGTAAEAARERWVGRITN